MRHEVRTFGTTTAELETLGGWLRAEGCTHGVLESTGVYWKPVWAVLAAADLTLVLAHAAAVRNMPGRKSDVKDARWLADLLAHGLVRPSFVPPAAQQALRELTRTRKQLVREITAHTQRIQKLLESANVKLGSVLTDVLGPSGRAIVEGLVRGETDAERLADQLHARSQPKRAAVVAALQTIVRTTLRKLTERPFSDAWPLRPLRPGSPSLRGRADGAGHGRRGLVTGERQGEVGAVVDDVLDQAERVEQHVPHHGRHRHAEAPGAILQMTVERFRHARVQDPLLPLVLGRAHGVDLYSNVIHSSSHVTQEGGREQHYEKRDPVSA